MRKVAIVIDLDNTLIDTAIRKLLILQNCFNLKDVTEDKVRSDFNLTQILGWPKSEVSKQFFNKLDSKEGIDIEWTPMSRQKTGLFKVDHSSLFISSFSQF